MFNLKYEDRLSAWKSFRNGLETAKDPIQDVINLYNTAPIVSIHIDPYDRFTWPDPWTLIYENSYCEFATILGKAYTLQLTERFSQKQFEIHTCIDREKSELMHLLLVDNAVIGFDRSKAVKASSLPEHLVIDNKYQLLQLR